MNQRINISNNRTKVGLLLCDYISPQYQYIASGYTEMFTVTYPNFELEVFAVCDGVFPESVDACEAYICTGSHRSVYEEEDWIFRLKDFVREIYVHQKKYIGHCFGHQLLAEALGGKVQKAEVGWCVGVHTFEIVQREAWMLPFQQSFNVLMLCQDQVQELPPDSVVLASGKDAPIGMFRVGEHMLGIQGHPEFTKVYERAVMEDRVEKIGALKVKKAVKSLTLPLDRDLMVEWIEQFLGGEF